MKNLKKTFSNLEEEILYYRKKKCCDPIPFLSGRRNSRYSRFCWNSLDLSEKPKKLKPM